MDRIELVARSLAPNNNVLFDDKALNGFIRFASKRNQVPLLRSRIRIHATEIAEWSDEELRQCIRTLAAGNI